MKNKWIPYVVFVVLIVFAAFAFWFNHTEPTPSNYSQQSSQHITTSPAPLSSQEISAPNIAATQSYAYLFEAENDPTTSNIVGYFGNGAFAWYVPDWLAQNWRIVSYGSEGMVFTPLARNDANDFSDISFSIGSSTELYNAENLYQTRLDTALKSDIILNEVLLNKQGNGTITMDIETDTRIYHIIDKDADGIHTRDTYYLDGNKETLVISFEAKSAIFSQFANKIQDMVEGVGELKAPQG